MKPERANREYTQARQIIATAQRFLNGEEQRDKFVRRTYIVEGADGPYQASKEPRYDLTKTQLTAIVKAFNKRLLELRSSITIDP